MTKRGDMSARLSDVHQVVCNILFNTFGFKYL